MTDIGSDPGFCQTLWNWQQLNDQLKALKKQEMALRKQIVALGFPDPLEGTNRLQLPQGYNLVAVIGYSRDLDFPAFQVHAPELTAANVNPDTLINFKPTLDIKAYKALDEMPRLIVDRSITLKPKAPSLKIDKPGAKKGKPEDDSDEEE